MPSIPTTIVPTWPAARRLADPARVVGFALAVLLLEAVLAHGIVGPQISKLVFLFIGAFVVAFVFRFPMPTALVVIGLTDFVFYPTYFAHQVGPVSVRPHELALACLLGAAILRPRRHSWGGAPGKALLVFYGMVAVSSISAVSSGSASLSDTFNFARPLFELSFFYVIVRLFPEPRQRRTLLLGAAVIAAATGVVALLTSLGAGFGSALQAAGNQTIRAENGLDSIDRVRLPGLSAGYALFWYVAVQIAMRKGGKKLGWSALLIGITVDVIVSFNRNMWLGLFLGLFLMMWFGGVYLRSRLSTAIGILVALVVLVAIVGIPGSNSSTVAPIVKRGSTLFNPEKTTNEGSLQARFKETSEAWPAVQRNLLIGVGAGASYGVTEEEQIVSGTTVYGNRVVPQLFLHNQYLYLILISGLPGLIAFLVFLLVPLTAAFRRPVKDPAIAACGLGIGLVMLSALVAIYFTVEDMTAALGILTGVIMADREGPAADDEPSGLLA
ncbi:MAG: O-antigen ligase family protein [Solirubrobacterales bacterium]|nr:O-antigen ligase family protein [Solirubrobacterales bacterium]